MTGAATPAVRARGWRLLSTLYLRGPVPDVLPAVRAVPALAGVLADPFDPDEAAAEHHRLFSIEVLPYASVFLEADASLGGPVGGGAARAFGRAGLEPPDPGRAPDHLGQQLWLLARLTADDGPEAAGRLLRGHLLWWLPAFVHAALRHAGPFWRVVLELTLEAALDQASAPLAGEPGPPGGLADPVEDPLADPRTGLAGVARYLASPARSGSYLAPSDVRVLGRGSDAPQGFGPRTRLLETLLRSASAYGRLDRVVEGLVSMIDAQAEFLGGVGLPEPWREPWTARLGGQRRVLGRLRDAAAREGG